MFRHLRKLRLRSIVTLGIAVLPTCVGVAVAVKTPAGNGSVFPSRLPAPTVNERAGEVDLVAQRAAEISTPAVVINVDGRLEALARGIDSALWDIWQTSPSGGWSQWERVGGVVTGDPVGVSNADGDAVHRLSA